MKFKISEKLNLYLLFFWGILCQGIFATLSNEENRLSSDFLVRKRRVINHLPEGRQATLIHEVRFIVKIRQENRAVCAGSILSHYTVITAATCIRQHVSTYKVLSGGTYDNRSNFHNVTSNVAYYGNPPHQNQEQEGISLITVDPPFEYGRKTGNVHLHAVEPLPTGTMVSVFGWGCVYPLHPGPESRPILHFITLPIMNHRDCQNDYRDRLTITEKHICTYDEQQYCARGDIGAPLVINNRLAGIHAFKGEFIFRTNPDVFINLQRADYNEWITDNALLM